MRVLIADDDVTTRRMLRAGLTRWGYEVSEVAGGEEAWARLSGPDAETVAIIDWMMPGISGPELCRRLRQEGQERSVYVILLTSRADARDVREGLESGADDYVAKPYHPDELRARVGVGQRVMELRRQLLEANCLLEDRVRQRTSEVERLLRWDEELLHHLSHDLKTPLTPLVSLLPILLETETDPDRRQMLEWAVSGARSIEAMSTGVLELCRVTAEAGKPRPVVLEVRGLVEAVLAQARLLSTVGGRELCNEVPQGLLVRVDPTHFRRAMDRLVANAVQFTQATGRIWVNARNESGSVTVSVGDDGVGLGDDQISRVFEPFYKADPSRHDREALGLGLTVARILVEQHGGRIWAESPGLGRGSVFHSTWPVGTNEANREGNV